MKNTLIDSIINGHDELCINLQRTLRGFKNGNVSDFDRGRRPAKTNLMLRFVSQSAHYNKTANKAAKNSRLIFPEFTLSSIIFYCVCPTLTFFSSETSNNEFLCFEFHRYYD